MGLEGLAFELSNKQIYRAVSGQVGFSVDLSNKQIYRAVSGQIGFSVGFENVLVYLLTWQGTPVAGANVLIKDDDSIIPDKSLISNDFGYFFSLSTYTGSVNITITKEGFNDTILTIDTQTESFPFEIVMTKRYTYRVKAIGGGVGGGYSNEAYVDF